MARGWHGWHTSYEFFDKKRANPVPSPRGVGTPKKGILQREIGKCANRATVPSLSQTSGSCSKKDILALKRSKRRHFI